MKTRKARRKAVLERVAAVLDDCMKTLLNEDRIGMMEHPQLVDGLHQSLRSIQSLAKDEEDED